MYNGGGFIGIGEPTAYQHEGHYFQLANVLGVDKELDLAYQQINILLILSKIILFLLTAANLILAKG